MPQEVYIASLVFFIIAVIGLMTVLQIILRPMSFIKSSTIASGINFNEVAGKDEQNFNASKFLFKYIAGIMLGCNLFTLVVSLTAFREMQAWSWYVMWYWPVLFIWNVFIYSSKTLMWYVQIFWFIVCVGVLIWTRPFFI